MRNLKKRGYIKADIHQINCNYKMLENDYRNIIGWTPYAIPRKGNAGIQKINPLSKIKSLEAYTCNGSPSKTSDIKTPSGEK